MKSIPIVLASDEKYIAPTYITILSALVNKRSETLYSFFVLHPDDLSDNAKQILIALGKKYYTHITMINMGSIFSDIKMKIDHITAPTYYRLCLPNILRNKDKCIYLDSDIIVNNDLAKLYNIDMEDNYIGGVLSEGIILDKIYARELCKRIGLNNVSTYINAGVLLLNLKKIRESQLVEKWLTLVPKAFPAQDQDILNLTCFGKIKILPLQYNVMSKCKVIKSNIDDLNEKVYSMEDIKKARLNPIIIHYADKVKPWNDRSSVLSNYWWNIYNAVDDRNAKNYIDTSINDLKKNIRTAPEKKVKNKIIRLTQILGIYSLFKKN